MVVVFVRVEAFLILAEQLVAVEQLHCCCYLNRLAALAWAEQLLVLLLPPLLHQVLVLVVVRLIIHEGVDLQLDPLLLIFLLLAEIWRFDSWFLYYGNLVLPIDIHQVRNCGLDDIEVVEVISYSLSI